MTVTSTRRSVLVLAAAAAVSLKTGAGRASTETDVIIADFARGKIPTTGGMRLNIPQVAENGHAVLVSVEVDSAMSGADRVEAIAIVAEANPHPQIVTMEFSELAASARVTTRIRLARDQTVTALARMADGSVRMDRRPVEVIVGGCGA